MYSESDAAVQFLIAQLQAAALRSDSKPSAMPVASLQQIESAEAELELELPATLKRIYREIGNGGRHLGPGYGLLGLPGAYDNDDGWNIIKTTRETAKGLEWWDRIVVICDWGCCLLSCVDCSDADFTVYRWDGNFFESPGDLFDPSDELWTIEADTFDAWLLTPNYDIKLP